MQSEADKQSQLFERNHENIPNRASEKFIISTNKTNNVNVTKKLEEIDIVNDNNERSGRGSRESNGSLDFSKEQLKIEETVNENIPPKDNVDKIKIKICQNCNTHHLEGTCPVEFPSYVITDALDRNEWLKKYKSIYDKQCDDHSTDAVNNKLNKFCYSILSKPDCLSLSVVQDELRVFAKTDFQPFTQFGPLVGEVVKEKDIPEDIEMKYLWEAFDSAGNVYFNTENASLSNWVKYMRPAPDKGEKNITVMSKGKKLYFVSVKSIKTGDELLYWQYSAQSTTGKKKLEKSGKFHR